MNAKHTPGPWRVAPDVIDEEQSLDYLRVETKDADIASRILIDEDANLIAAAPDLLAALKRCVVSLHNAGIGIKCGELQEAHAAIAKATGETK